MSKNIYPQVFSPLSPLTTMRVSSEKMPSENNFNGNYLENPSQWILLMRKSRKVMPQVGYPPLQSVQIPD